MFKVIFLIFFNLFQFVLMFFQIFSIIFQFFRFFCFFMETNNFKHEFDTLYRLVMKTLVFPSLIKAQIKNSNKKKNPK